MAEQGTLHFEIIDDLHEQESEQKRLQKLKKVMERTKKIRTNNLSSLLGFPNKVECLDWIFELPDDFKIILDGDFIIFSQKSSKKVDEALKKLNQEFETWETKDKKKKV